MKYTTHNETIAYMAKSDAAIKHAEGKHLAKDCAIYN